MEQSKDKNIVTKSKAQNALKDIYCISGLGADRRVFQKLKFKGYQPVHIDWLEPDKKEDITNYAKRLTEQIKSSKPILIGLSFGGIIAVEIAKHIAVEKVILVSSVKQYLEIPVYFRMFRWFPIHRLIPFKSLLWAIYWLINWFFSLENLEERKLLKAILVDTDAKFLKWAIDRVVFWKNQIVPQVTYHLHGTSDRIFPFAFVDSDITIEKGGHFMIMNRADKISQLIDRIINNDVAAD
ncbi:MAG: alpha/beta hydrolase [Xenococcaceae cyanobacterium MO_188.B32]|nr:alpha/beta hydrolase [Xenococcaceae cyanobacterium MO_188.B32]